MAERATTARRGRGRLVGGSGGGGGGEDEVNLGGVRWLPAAGRTVVAMPPRLTRAAVVGSRRLVVRRAWVGM